MMRLVLVLVLLAAVFIGAITLASEMGGEVVVLTTRDDRDVEFRTSLWVVEHRGSLYLRAGDRGSNWFVRLEAEPRVKVERAGVTQAYRAHPEPGTTDIVNQLMARDYGLADQLIGVIRDETQSVAIRLEPIPDQAF